MFQALEVTCRASAHTVAELRPQLLLDGSSVVKSRWPGALMLVMTLVGEALDLRALTRCSGLSWPAFILGAKPLSSAQFSSRVTGGRRRLGEAVQGLPPQIGSQWVSIVILPPSLYPPARLCPVVPRLSNSRQEYFLPFLNPVFIF